VSEWAPILAAARLEHARFSNAWTRPREAQLGLLHDILARNRTSEFGRQHRFASLGSYADFCRHVPVRDYDGFREFIARAADGQNGILTSEPIVAFEETGGSSQGPKLIPYTRSALLSFRAAVLPWLADLADHRPRAFAGRAYVATSAAARPPQATASGIPVGLASEYAYLGDDIARDLPAVSIVPPEVGTIVDMDEWRRRTLAYMAGAADLTLVSVWSPTFLSGLVEALPRLADHVVRTLYDGENPGPNGSVRGVPDRERARIVERALRGAQPDTVRLWPHLDTISCWTDGAARPYANRLRALFPHARLQGKGLLATETAVTIPQWCAAHPVIAPLSAFLEFIDDEGGIRLCDELVEGGCYRIVVTTPGGLYRYDLGDYLRCRGHVNGAPMLEFVGRAGVCGDLVGEKLSDAFVADALSSLNVAACLVARAQAVPFYELLVDAPPGFSLDRAARAVEARLRANPQYAYARRLGQLGALVARSVPQLGEKHAQARARQQRRLADVKPPTIIREDAVYAAVTA
jgi:hypothetical protein